jgi:hypothetical protein
MGDYSFDLRPLIWAGALTVILIWCLWEAVDYFYIHDSIKSETRIEPEIKLIIKDNQVDTLFIYKQK